jgi:hypothetical protein
VCSQIGFFVRLFSPNRSSVPLACFEPDLTLE